MEEKRNNNNGKGDNASLIYTILILMGMILIGYISLYVPVLIFALLVISPFAIKLDMESAKPILSIAMVIVSGVFLCFNQFDYSLYMILVISTGLVALLCYIVWRYLGVEKFEDGLLYSIMISVSVGLIAALIIYFVKGRQPFTMEIVPPIKNWLLENKSEFMDRNIVTFHNYDIIFNGTGSFDFASFTQGISGAVDFGSEFTKAEKVERLAPYIQSVVDRYAISTILLYPAFAGAITWWRGNFRFYKNETITDDEKTLKPKPFSTFAIPRWLFTAIAILLLVSFFMQSPQSSEMLLNASLMIQSLAYLILSIQGYAVMEYFLKRVRVFRSSGTRIALMVFITIITLRMFPIFVGMVDMLINIRFVYSKSKEVKEKIQHNATTKKTENKEEDNSKDDDKK